MFFTERTTNFHEALQNDDRKSTARHIKICLPVVNTKVFGDAKAMAQHLEDPDVIPKLLGCSAVMARIAKLTVKGDMLIMDVSLGVRGKNGLCYGEHGIERQKHCNHLGAPSYASVLRTKLAKMIEGSPQAFRNCPRLEALLKGATIWQPSDEPENKVADETAPRDPVDRRNSVLNQAAQRIQRCFRRHLNRDGWSHYGTLVWKLADEPTWRQIERFTDSAITIQQHFRKWRAWRRAKLQAARVKKQPHVQWVHKGNCIDVPWKKSKRVIS
ncbi:hypothetical protein FOL47_001307 [Perkinsus chesapeaki]|uniref:Uncharacterized protein n=1 Tax=Perkinsus chesapeaki TaxID=330153 RepID=A0A7J6N0S8_PERCH|nr:hypothetical protein FOL47_001307 [Perkinsus chesapeaki]